jgi:DNA-binding NtrC family response regulator
MNKRISQKRAGSAGADRLAGTTTVAQLLGRVPRVVVADDEEWMGELFETAIGYAVGEVQILRFQNRDTAWEELQRSEPDLFITDMNNNNVPGHREYTGMSGWELLPRLAERAVKYPILVASGGFEMPGVESRARQLAGTKLNVAFMTKPFDLDFISAELRRLLSGQTGWGRRLSRER